MSQSPIHPKSFQFVEAPMSKKKASKRDVFAELMEGVGAMKQHREGKLTLRTHPLPAPEAEEASSPQAANSDRLRDHRSTACAATAKP